MFSHPSKLDLLDQATAAGYYGRRDVLAIPAALAVQRVRCRVAAPRRTGQPQGHLRHRHAYQHHLMRICMLR